MNFSFFGISSPSYNSNFSDRIIKQARKCKMDPSCSDTLWTSWSPWSSCSVTCGSGTQNRNRACKGSKCVGAPSQSSTCVKAPCALKSFRSLQSRTNQSENSSSSLSGRRIFGQNNQSEAEKDYQGSTDHLWSWGEWGTWAECTKSCGTGLTWRKSAHFCADSARSCCQISGWR